MKRPDNGRTWSPRYSVNPSLGGGPVALFHSGISVPNPGPDHPSTEEVCQGKFNSLSSSRLTPTEILLPTSVESSSLTLRDHIHTFALLQCPGVTGLHTKFESGESAVHYLDPPLDKALDGTFGSQGILLNFDFPLFNEGIGL